MDINAEIKAFWSRRSLSAKIFLLYALGVILWGWMRNAMIDLYVIYIFLGLFVLLIIKSINFIRNLVILRQEALKPYDRPIIGIVLVYIVSVGWLGFFIKDDYLVWTFPSWPLLTFCFDRCGSRMILALLFNGILIGAILRVICGWCARKNITQQKDRE